MNRHIKVDPDTSGSIDKMIGQNLNLSQISKALKNERNIVLAHPTLRGYVLRTFHKEWDKGNKKWIDSKPLTKRSKDFLENQLEIDLGIEEMKSSHDPIHSIQNSDNIPQKTVPTDNSSLSFMAERQSITQVHESVTCVLQKMYRLQKDVDEIKKILLQIQDDNPRNKLFELGDEFIRIYASEKSKSSVTVNAELKEKVKKFIEQSYGIKDNDSLVINIALLLALYRGK